MADTSVVVGTDGSGPALRAVEWAAREATAREEPLRIVSVPWAWPISTPPGNFSFAVSREITDADRAAADRAIGTAADRVAELFPGLQVGTEVIAGSPVEVLLRCAADASILVVGSRGAGGFAAMMIGSESRCLASQSLRPVVVVPEQTMTVHRAVVVGVREPERAAAALRFGFEAAARRHSRLLVMHASGAPRWPAAGDRMKRRIDPDQVRAIAAQLDSQLTGWVKEYPEVELGQDIVRGHPGRVLATAAGRADLVVLGRHRAAGSPAPIGSTLNAVLTHAHGPVAIIPDR